MITAIEIEQQLAEWNAVDRASLDRDGKQRHETAGLRLASIKAALDKEAAKKARKEAQEAPFIRPVPSTGNPPQDSPIAVPVRKGD